MNAETIKSFLVSLGFDIDDAGARKFDATIVGATKKAIALGVAVEAAALSVVALTTKVASGLDNLYWASQRTGATVAGIQAIGYAVSQTGGSADAARGSLESLARFVRTSPGAEGFLNRLGVQTRDASGNMQDMASIFTGVGQKLSSMPYYRANQYTSMLGIDENTLLAMRRGLGEFSTQYTATAKAIGFNADMAAKSSNRFMTSLNSFGMMAEMARDKIGSSLTDGLSGSIDRLRKQILDNFPEIEQGITVAIKGILWLAEAVGRVMFRLFQAAGDISDWWGTLDEDSKGLIKTLGALLVAWRLLNDAMWSSPVTWVLALAGALFLLYDDYKTWKEGGKSLINWADWEPQINAALDGIDTLWSGVKRLKEEILDLFGIDPKTWSIKFEFDSLKKQFGELSKMLDTIGQLIRAIDDGRWSDAASLAKQLLNQGGGQPDALPGVTGSAKGAADWVTDKTGFDPRSIGQWVRGKFGGRPEPTKAGAAVLGWLGPTLDNLERLYRLPEGVLRGVALAESGGDQFAVGPQTKYGQAKGMFQIIDGTARDLGLKGNDVFDPVKSAQAAAKYLSQLMQANGGDLDKALASYNWGIGNVQKYGMDLMPRETQNYIPRVRSNMPGPSMQQEVNINIHGVSNPQEAGNIVANKQAGIIANGIQQLSAGPK
ncbi:transglycosylase SLT domain-containing protein [Erwinia rhapontici]|uniref:lytic transglycosylase domain-containing protein n=1 Tax=Erwinia rhapontici TaxID=55212 RepID=UPI00105F5717|nr:transglycosylase SLT domain-containing protein [Erwinia rhapontici]TDT01687.1 transglycosylase-like protein with SLT domain [Erwinia rhapontici]